MKVCTQNFGKGAQKIDVYKKLGGYANTQKILFGLSSFEVIDLVQRSGLRGRGGAGFPTGMKWSFVPRGGKPVYIAVNADEGEPGTFKDHFLMREDPHKLIEGLIIAGWALGARNAYIYVRGEFLPAIESLTSAIREAYAANLLGKNICGTKYSLDITVHRGAGAYVCGEETALINSLEGQKGQPRLKPPFPAVNGAWNMPTCVNNVETIMALPWILENGAEAYAALGTPKAGGTKVFCVSGDVKRRGVFEARLGIPLMELLESEEYCGGVVGNLKGCIPGGSSTQVLTPEECKKANLDYESLAAMGTMFGSGAVMPFNDTHGIVEMLNTLGKFYSHESCGQCTPCREGTGYAKRIITGIAKGRGHDGDIELLESISNGFTGTTICPLAAALGAPIQSYLQKFRSEFEDAILKKPNHAEARLTDDYRPEGWWE
ncbi:NADH-quinone oxidoreductase subunit F [Fibrobacterales bacterium]|nr:NADH-quinone oxidoreductase subunit F [Fibrobacterales bacterium]